MTPPVADQDGALRASRRRLVVDGVGIIAGVIGFGLVYGLSARSAGLSLLEAVAMSALVFAGASQFAAVGALTQGVGWPAIVLLTAFLNARHLLYSAALAPWLTSTPRRTRAGMAFVLTDEAFALGIAHFRRIGRADRTGYWYAAVVGVFIPWNLATIAGVLLGGAVPDPTALGLDVVFPAAMAGLAFGLATGRREVVAAASGAVVAVAVSLAGGTSSGIIAGALAGPAIAMIVHGGPVRRTNPLPVAGSTQLDVRMTEVSPPLDGQGAEVGSAPPDDDPSIGAAP